MMSLTALTEMLQVEIENVFNPYIHNCHVHDRDNAAELRLSVVLDIIERARLSRVDAIWIGRDLGYRGGRRTGLALTDDFHFVSHLRRWGLNGNLPVKTPPIAERTASTVWKVLEEISDNVFLWNVFPFHPHLPGDPFSNRAHSSAERLLGENILTELVALLKPRRVISIGNDATRTAKKLHLSCPLVNARHPSYGGKADFERQIRAAYADSKRVNALL